MPVPSETVILIPGLWLPASALLPWQHWLRQAGYAVRRFGYRSWRHGLDDNVAALDHCLAVTAGQRIHLVGHSLGGLLILQRLARGQPARFGRAVLLGAPALGSHSAVRLGASAGGRWLLGRSLADWRPLRPSGESPSAEIGVIAGTRSCGLGRLLGGLARPNDGAVAVAETRWPGAADFLTIPVSHSGMLLSAACARQVAHFLAGGRFVHA